MKNKLVLVLIPGAVIALLAGLLLFVHAQSTRADAGLLYVAPGGVCGGALPCYASLQAAVDAAAPGDEIRVAQGVYTETNVRPRMDVTTTGLVTQALYLTKTVTVFGSFSSDFTAWDPLLYTTTLDAQGRGRGVYIAGEIARARLQGLRITGGNARGLQGYFYYGNKDAGGGVFIITATAALIGNRIEANVAESGGGVFLNTASSRLVDNRITGNQAQTSGGGITVYQGAPTLQGNVFHLNQSDNLGGGAYLFFTTAVLDRNQFTANLALYSGGGVLVASCSPTFNGNLFSGNGAWIGGGVYLWYSSSSFTNDVFLENHAGDSGSGLYAGGSSFTLLQSTFSTNNGGNGSGLFIDSTNTGGVTSHIVISNTLVVSHSVGISLTGESTALIGGILWYQTPITVSLSQGATILAIQHQHTGDPAFTPDGYHLSAASAAIHEGQPEGVLSDIDGQPRWLASPDLGADEYWQPGAPYLLYLPLVRK